MKILLINCPIKLNSPPIHVPTGLAYIARVLLEDGHTVSVLDINGWRYDQKTVSAKLKEYSDVEVVGISGLITTYGFQKWLIAEVKKAVPKAVIISGGGAATSCPELLFANTALDIAVIGEGEITIKELVRSLADHRPLDDIRGICFRSNGSMKKNAPRELIPNLDSLPLPAYELFPIERYLKNPVMLSSKRSMNFFTGRGCPYRCKFCYHIFGRGRIRLRSVENMLEEIRFLKKRYQIDFLAIYDDNTTVDKNRLRKFCQLIGKENLVWVGYGRVDSVDEETLRLMKAANCKAIGYGIESGSQRILDNMDKGIKVEQAKRAIALTRKSGIYAATSFILGYPGETAQTIQETVDFCIEMNLPVVDFYFAQAYPGTPLYEEARQRGLIMNEEEYILELESADKFVINFTDFSDEELLDYKKKVIRQVLQGCIRQYPLQSIKKFLSFILDRSKNRRSLLSVFKYLLQDGG
ncbi:MAG: B12-binding domain-containing radical SAM protein [Candidatus Omnitrophota bacterium]